MGRISEWWLERVRGWLRGTADQFLTETVHFKEHSQATLEGILQLNGETEWGRAHGLNGPQALDTFQALAPNQYEDYAPYIERMAAGEKNLLTKQPVEYFAESSGTTGPQKLIPITRQQITLALSNSMSIPFGMAVRAGILGPICGPVLMTMTEMLRGQTPGGIAKGAATTSGIRRMGRVSDWLFTSPREVVKIQPQTTARYLHLLFALRASDIWMISSFFPLTLMYIFRDLEEKAPALLRDLADGTLSPELELSAAERKDLLARWKPQPERARFLEQKFKQPSWTVRDFWPGVGCVITVSTGSFRFYADQIRRYLGPVPIFSPIYAASEASGIGFALEPDQPGYVFSSRSAYLELLPVDSLGEASGFPIPAWKAEPGQSYEVVITTWGGLVRYRLGDVVKAVGFHNEAPVVEFVERRGRGLNLAGEKMPEHYLQEAWAAARQEVHFPLVDYFVTIDLSTTPSRYLVVLESAVKWQPEMEFSLKKLLERFDVYLIKAAPRYQYHRQYGNIAPLGGIVLRSGAFERYRDFRMSQGVSASQFKMLHVIPDPGFVTQYFGEEIVGRFLS